MTKWKDQIALFFNPLQTNKKLYFSTLNYVPNYTLHPKL